MQSLSVQRAVSRTDTPSWLRTLARTGLLAKGVTYCLFGILVFMAAFHIGGRSAGSTDRSGIFNLLDEAPGGIWLVALLALGLACYAAWRFVEAVRPPRSAKGGAKGLARRARYAISGAGYASLAVLAARYALTHHRSSGDKQQNAAQELLQQPAGQWLAGAAALILIGVGIYQLWYGWSERYRKHVPHATLQKAGKVGYTARGIVWILLGWLFGRAALHSNASEAGDTSKAFQFIATGTWGPWLLGALGLGLICYGVYNFLRAKHDPIGT
ncbi:MAG: DUF1206 domain-containing protein [Chitinophagaceae bacterium]|nr:MAG: DUF1206 domain-containing protein [Chitinophagaceae bacterium]